jgi:hypothetical protein
VGFLEICFDCYNESKSSPGALRQRPLLLQTIQSQLIAKQNHPDPVITPQKMPQIEAFPVRGQCQPNARLRPQSKAGRRALTRLSQETPRRAEKGFRGASHAAHTVVSKGRKGLRRKAEEVDGGAG